MKNKKNNYKTIIIAVIATFLLTAFTVAQLTSLKVNAGDTLTATQWNLLVDAVENAAKDLPEPTANTDAATKSYVDAAGDSGSCFKTTGTCGGGYVEASSMTMYSCYTVGTIYESGGSGSSSFTNSLVPCASSGDVIVGSIKGDITAISAVTSSSTTVKVCCKQ